MSDIREMLSDSTVRIMKDLCTKELVNNVELGNWATDLWDVVEESGLTTIAVREEVGGTGGSYGDALSMIRIAGKYSAPIPIAETLMANWLLDEAGLPISSKPYTLIPHLSNQHFTFTNVVDGWLISGSSSNVPWAKFTNGIVVSGQSPDGFLVTVLNPEKCTITPGKNLAGEPRDRIEVKDQYLRLEEVSILSRDVLLKYEYIGALVKSVLMAGALERILELSTLYTKERTQFGRPLHRFQAIQHHLATLAGEVAAANIAAEYGVMAIDTTEFRTEAIISKIRIGEAASTSVPIAHQVIGAIGFTDEHVLHQSTRRLWAWRDEYGSESFWADQLGEMVINNGPEALWPFLTKEGKSKVNNL